MSIIQNQPPIQTPQQEAIQYARDVSSAAQNTINLFLEFQSLTQRQGGRNYIGILNSMQTYALNPDGSAGAVDVSPVNTNPIVGLDISASDLSAFIGYGIGDITTLLTGTGALSQINRLPVVEKIVP